MSHKTAAMDQPVKFSRKCRECGLRNFIDATVCRRCEADLSQRPTKANESTKPKDIEQIPEQPVEPAQSKGRSLSILAAALVILFALVLFYVRQSSHESEAMAGQAGCPTGTLGDANCGPSADSTANGGGGAGNVACGGSSGRAA